MQTSSRGFNLIRRFAPLNLMSHLDIPGWIVGYACRDYPGWRVSPGYKISRDDADRLLLERVAYIEQLINRHIPTELSQNEFDALVCHIYFMLRPQDFPKSEIARHLIAGDKEATATAILCDAVDPERERRTLDEARLFRNLEG